MVLVPPDQMGIGRLCCGRLVHFARRQKKNQFTKRAFRKGQHMAPQGPTHMAPPPSSRPTLVQLSAQHAVATLEDDDGKRWIYDANEVHALPHAAAVGGAFVREHSKAWFLGECASRTNRGRPVSVPIGASDGNRRQVRDDRLRRRRRVGDGLSGRFGVCSVAGAGHAGMYRVLTVARFGEALPPLRRFTLSLDS